MQNQKYIHSLNLLITLSINVAHLITSINIERCQSINKHAF